MGHKTDVKDFIEFGLIHCIIKRNRSNATQKMATSVPIKSQCR